MTYKCPYTETCRAEALRTLAEVPALAAIFEQRLQCTEQDPQQAEHCARQIGLINLTRPALGKYVQGQRQIDVMLCPQYRQCSRIPDQTIFAIRVNILNTR